MDELANAWQGLDTQNKVLTGAGGALALGALVNQFRPHGEGDSAGTGMNLMAGLGGLGLGAYGLSGGKLDNILPTLQRIVGSGGASGPPPQSTNSAPAPGGTTASLGSLAHDPAFGKYFNSDGSVRFQDLVKAPDAELQAGVARLNPQQRTSLSQHLNSFQPSFAQRLGAKAVGIDVDAQRQRFQKLLA